MNQNVSMLIFSSLQVTVGIRIVADCGAQIFQFTIKLKRATTFESTTEPAIIFIHCYGLFLFLTTCFKRFSVN
jgi:hypothetical protein